MRFIGRVSNPDTEQNREGRRRPAGGWTGRITCMESQHQVLYHLTCARVTASIPRLFAQGWISHEADEV